MTQPKRGLGRGLDALFSHSSNTQPEPLDAVEEVPIAPAQPPAEPPVEPVATVWPPNLRTAKGESNPVEDVPPAPVAEVISETPIAQVQPPVPAKPMPSPAPAPPIVAAPRAEEPVPPPANGHRDEPSTAYAQPVPRQEPPAYPERTTDHARPEPAVPSAPAPAAQQPVPVYRRGGPDEVDIDLVSPNPEQPRTHFEPEKLRELADSIREHGIIQPLIVSRDESGAYRLIAGERRLQAARLAGLDTVPIVVREAADAELLELALIENIQRADLNAIEEAMAYRRLTEEYGLTQEEAARRVGKSRVTVSNALRLLQLEGEIRRSLVSGEISEGHARALLGLPEGRGRITAWREVVKRRLSVRDTEGYVRRTLTESPATSASPGAVTARRDAAISDIEGRLRRALSTRVMVQPQKKGARITIECYSNEEFENVVNTLLGEYA